MADAVGFLAKAAFVKSRGLIGAAKPITGATNTSPIVITTSALHGYLTGDRVLIEGVLGNTAANGYWNITVLTNTTFSLDNSAGNGAYVSGGTSERLPWYPEQPGSTILGATHMVPFASEGIVKAIDRSKSPALVGAGIQKTSEIVGVSPAGSFEGPLTWRGWERLVMCSMGFEHPDDSPATLIAGAYAHLFERDETMQMQPWTSGVERAAGGWDSEDRKMRCGALGLCKQISDWVWESVMISKITFAGTPSEVKVTLDLVGYDLAKGSYNSASWTLPSGSDAMCLFSQSVLKLGTRAGGAGALSIYEPSLWEITLDNKPASDDRTTASSPNIVQPVRSDFVDVTLKLEFPRYYTQLEALLDLFEANTELAASLILTGPQIAATGEYRKWSFFMSSLFGGTPTAPIDGPGAIKSSFEFTAHRPGGSDIFESGFYEGITLVKDSELIVMCQNEDSADYITEN